MKLDFSSRYQAAFGFVAANVSSRIQNYGEIVQELFGKNDNRKPTGLNVYVWDKKTTFDEVTLYRGTESYHFGFGSLSGESTEVFAFAPMLSLKRDKKLVISSLDDSDTEVVERFATSPYDITWRGLLVDMDNHSFPLEKLEKLNLIFEKNEVWNVSSEILGAVGVKALFIQDVAIDFVEGFEDTISYVFTMRAIKPIEYQLIEK